MVCGVRGGKPVAHHALDHVGRLERQDRLALGGAIGGLAHADVGAHADRLRALQVEHVHDLAAVEHGEMHRLVHLLAQIAQQRPRLVRHGHAPAHQRAQPEQCDAEPVFAGVGILLQHAVGDKRHREAMHRALGDAEPLGQIADADLDLLLGKGLEQPHRGRDRGQAALVGRREMAYVASARYCSAPWTGVPRDCRAFRAMCERRSQMARKDGMARNIVVIGGGPAAVFAAIEAKKARRRGERHARHRRGLRALREAAAVEGRAARQGQARGRADRRPRRARQAWHRGQAQHPLHRDRPRRARASSPPAGRLPYDALVIATGSLMRELPLLPMGMPRVHYLRTEAHARAIKAGLAGLQASGGDRRRPDRARSRGLRRRARQSR